MTEYSFDHFTFTPGINNHIIVLHIVIPTIASQQMRFGQNTSSLMICYFLFILSIYHDHSCVIRIHEVEKRSYKREITSIEYLQCKLFQGQARSTGYKHLLEADQNLPRLIHTPIRYRETIFHLSGKVLI